MKTTCVTHSNFASLKPKPFIAIRKGFKYYVGVFIYRLKPSRLLFSDFFFQTESLELVWIHREIV